uniref:SUMO specific peptidase 2 n=1 Tax=Corvus moneduloides TaxID=1196302 RepID=A0A8U7NUW4_CORMO
MLRSGKRRREPSVARVLSCVEDPEIPAKKQKAECVSGANEEPKEVSVAAKLPPEATRKSQETKESDDFSFSESEDEVVHISSDSLFVASSEDEAVTEPDEMPCDTTLCLTEETPSSLCKRVPYLSPSRDNHIQAAPESPVTPRPPIKEPGPNSPRGSGTRRPLCAAEEDVQQAENKKYKELLSLFKEKYSGKLTSPRLARLNKVQAKEPGMTGSPLKERKSSRASPPVPGKTSVKHGDVFSPQLPQRGVMISYYTPPEDSRGQGKREKRAASVAMESEISAAFDGGEPEDVLSRAFKLAVTREDICTLQPLGWLNDSIVNFYMSLLVERSKKEGYPAVYAFNTFFYSKLSSTSHRGVKKWTKGVDIFKHDVLLVPIHLRIHWTLLVVDLREKAIKYFDSLGQKGDHICKTVLKYLEEESKEKRNIELTASEWTLRSLGAEEIPQQSNGSDCGVFVCKFADFITRDKPIIFTPVRGGVNNSSLSHTHAGAREAAQQLGQGLRVCSSCLLPASWARCSIMGIPGWSGLEWTLKTISFQHQDAAASGLGYLAFMSLGEIGFPLGSAQTTQPLVIFQCGDL